MEARQTAALIQGWLEGRGCGVAESWNGGAPHGAFVRAEGEEETWYIALRQDFRRDPAAYIHSFDGGIDRLIAISAGEAAPPRLAVALPFSSTEQGRELSYRRILKKYSNSVIFEDLGIHLLLVRDDHSVEVIRPSEVNRFLRNLNRLIASKRRGRGES